MSRPLVPLRIPAGWAVIFNIFVDFSDQEEISQEDVDSYLSDDILSVEKLRFTGDRWETDPVDVLIDLSWSEPGSTTGEYVLSVIQGGWEGSTATFRHRDTYRIRDAIELTFEELLAGRAIPELAKVFSTLTENDGRRGGGPDDRGVPRL